MLHVPSQQLHLHHWNLVLTIIPLPMVSEGFQGLQHPYQHVLNSFANLPVAGEEGMMEFQPYCFLYHWLLYARDGHSTGILAPNHGFPFELGGKDVAILRSPSKLGTLVFLTFFLIFCLCRTACEILVS